MPGPLDLELWTMTVDGVVNSKGVGVGITKPSPFAHYERSRSIKLDYPLSNNQAEYEAPIIGMIWALSEGIQVIKDYIDS